MNKEQAKKLWIKPSITPVRSAGLNKFGTSRHQQWQDNIDGIAISDLVDQYGSPLYVVSEPHLRRNFQNISRAFSSRYPQVVFAWSYKTNYLGAVCNTLHQEGAWAEVVSQFEYEKARALGVPGNKIIFNGPFKNEGILRRAIEEHARIHIDHYDELYLLDRCAAEMKKKVNVAIRLNFDTGYTEPWSRFGFNVENGSAMDAAWRIKESPYLKLTGLHSHIGTFVMEPKAYATQVETLCGFMSEVEGRTQCDIEYLDIGGGFASMNALQGIYLPPEQVIPSVDQYAEAITSVLLKLTHERSAKGCPRPTLILESGRAIVDDAEVLISSVFANKQLPDGRRASIMDAGVNLLFTSFWYNHDVIPTRPLEGRPEDTVLFGPLCMNIDVLRHSVQLPPLEVGDRVIFTPVGAYNNTQWLQFIEYRPNVIMTHKDGTSSVIRDAENLEIVTAQEHIPEHLKNIF